MARKRRNSCWTREGEEEDGRREWNGRRGSRATNKYFTVPSREIFLVSRGFHEEFAGEEILRFEKQQTKKKCT